MPTLYTALESCLPAVIIPDVVDYAIKRLAAEITKSPAPKKLDPTSLTKVPQPSRVAQAIIPVLAAHAEGITLTEIGKLVLTYKAERISKALATMAKAKPALAYKKGSKWFNGAAPRSATGSNRTTTPGDVTLADATLDAVRALPPGSTSKSVTAYLARKGMIVRSNHVGIALARHAMADRLTRMGEKPNFTYSIPLAATG